MEERTSLKFRHFLKESFLCLSKLRCLRKISFIFLNLNVAILSRLSFKVIKKFKRLPYKDSSIVFEKKEIPKIIWMAWFQGESQAPVVVKRCLASWRKHNPEWEIRVLDRQSIENYLPWEEIKRGYKSELSLQTESDLLRWQLLFHYGGIWVDATCFCTKPLDD